MKKAGLWGTARKRKGTSRKGLVVKELLDLLGEEGLNKLVQERGGTSFRVPLGMTQRGRAQTEALAAILGDEGVRRLVGRFGGAMLYVPGFRQARVDRRDQCINRQRDELAREGVGERELVRLLALRHELSDRQIWRILKKTVVIPEHSGLWLPRQHNPAARC